MICMYTLSSLHVIGIDPQPPHEFSKNASTVVSVSGKYVYICLSRLIIITHVQTIVAVCKYKV